MAVLTRQQVYDLARSVGLGQFDAATAGAICDAESGRNTQATGYNRDPFGDVLSTDRGLWQINSYYHREVSDACAYDAGCNAQAMARISHNGTVWTPWSTFNSGAYRGFLPLYLEIAGLARPAPPPPQDVVQHLVTDIRAGLPVFKAILLALERVVTDIRRGSFDHGAAGTDLGSRLF